MKASPRAVAEVLAKDDEIMSGLRRVADGTADANEAAVFAVLFIIRVKQRFGETPELGDFARITHELAELLYPRKSA